MASWGEISGENQPADILYLGPLFWNSLVWAPQKIVGVEFAQITPGDWNEHLTHPWVWDNDEFSVNQIGHPYQGSLAYGSARGAGWGFSESLSSTVFGSLTWELFMENETPSKNDLIVTTLGGAALGEMFFRISESLSAGGDFSVGKNLLALGLSPGGTLSRLVYGRDTETDAGPLSAVMNVNGGLTGGDEGFFHGKDSPVAGGLFIDLALSYGDREGKDILQPFDLFALRGGIGGGPEDFSAYFFSEGLLTGRPLYLRGGKEDSLGLFLHYDFVYDDIFNLSANSLGIGWLSGGSLSRAVHLSFVAMGGSECMVLKIFDKENGPPEEERRNYDLGVGGNLKILWEFPLSSFGTVRFRNYSYLFYLYQAEVPEGGSGGWTLKNLAEAELVRKLTGNLSFRCSLFYWSGKTDYWSLEDRQDRIYGFRTGMSWNLF